MASGVVFARLVAGAKVELLVAQNAAPIWPTQTLPGRQAVAVGAARIRDALVAMGPSPAGPTLARVGLVAVAVLLVATLATLGLVAVGALPAFETNLVARERAVVVAELVVSGATEGVASVAVVIERAVNSANGFVRIRD